MAKTVTYDIEDRKSLNSLIGKVYAYMGIGLLITVVVAASVGILMYLWLYGTLDASAVVSHDITPNENAVTTLFVLMIVSSLAILGMSFFISFRYIRAQRSLLLPAVIYCVIMGLLLSSFVVLLPWEVLLISFGITSLIFGIMWLIATLTKGSLQPLAMVGFGLLFGSMLIGLVGWLFLLTGWLEGYMNIYWIVSFATFAGMMFITMWDMWRIKQIARSGEMNDNLALFCAYRLYNDFIYILMRVIYLVARSYKR